MYQGKVIRGRDKACTRSHKLREYTYIEIRKHTITFPIKSKKITHEINTKRMEGIDTNHIKKEDLGR